MQKRFPITISLDSKVISRLDFERGLVSRSRFLERLISISMRSEN